MGHPEHTFFVWPGIALITLGGVALLFPYISTLAVTLLAGAAFATAGAVKLALALTSVLSARRRPPLRLALCTLWGLAYIAGGALLIAEPRAGAWSLTLVLAAMLIAAGLASIIWARSAPTSAGAGWMVASGIVTTGLGALVIAAMPVAALWFPGVIAGIDFLTTGVAFIAMAHAGHEAHSRAQAMMHPPHEDRVMINARI